MEASQTKVAWEGEVVSVQPRSTVWRYLLDNRTHREIGPQRVSGTGDAPRSGMRFAGWSPDGAFRRFAVGRCAQASAAAIMEADGSP